MSSTKREMLDRLKAALILSERFGENKECVVVNAEDLLATILILDRFIPEVKRSKEAPLKTVIGHKVVDLENDDDEDD